jgi:uncharacterized protein
MVRIRQEIVFLHKSNLKINFQNRQSLKMEFKEIISKTTKILLFVGLGNLGFAQQIAISDDKGVSFEEYEPKSTLVTPSNPKTKAKFPFIDVHNHQWDLTKDKFDQLVKDMDKLNMGLMVNLSGRGWTSDLEKSTAILTDQIKLSKASYPNRFAIFTNIDFSRINEAGWTEKAVKMLEEDVKVYGAKGLKIYKSLGFSVKNADGSLTRVDDPRIDALWAKAGELGVPVLIHTADPEMFWSPTDRYNERWLELKLHPNRKRDAGKKDFSWQELIEQQHNVFRKHTKTTFINAHMGWFPNNLAKLDSLMDAFPNMYCEIGAVIAEIGRQPKTAKKFFEKRQDRILFGKDSWVPDEYATYFRVLETEDEYFPYHKKYHAFWRMYGLGLSDEVLKKIYYKNALKIIPGLDKSQFPK